MQKWVRQNLTIAVIITLLAIYGAGAGIAAVFKSDIETLKSDVGKLKEQVNSLPSHIASIDAKLSDQGEDVRFIKNYMLRK